MRRFSDRVGLAWRLGAVILRPLLMLITRRDWRHVERIPVEGGAVIALNHVSHVDPILIGHLAWDHGRIARFLAKSSLFSAPGIIGWWFRHAGQIPVDRADGAAGMRAAIESVRRGELPVVYIEGSITKDPSGWPMRPKTGAARLALATGAPVIPIGQWGAQDLLPAYSRKPNLMRRATVHMNVGTPVDLADLHGRTDAEAVHIATDRIMAAVVSLVEELRGQKAPAERYDPMAHGQSATGRPRAS